MIILLDTSTPTCRLTIVDGAAQADFEWESGRNLAKGLLKFIEDKLQEVGGSWTAISGTGVMLGPGSFTGLRIGLTVANTLADSLSVPIVGATGQTWQDIAVSRLNNQENDRLVMPFYGGEAHITQPRK